MLNWVNSIALLINSPRIRQQKRKIELIVIILQKTRGDEGVGGDEGTKKQGGGVQGEKGKSLSLAPFSEAPLPLLSTVNVDVKLK